MEFAKVRGLPLPLKKGTYWHLAMAGSHLLHNVWLGKGVTTSSSFTSRQPGMEGAVSPYGLDRMNDAKEQVWESVRGTISPKSPSRLGALFLFDDEERARLAQATWFGDENRYLVRARLLAGLSSSARVDAEWLDGFEPEWVQRATEYWSGTMTDSPAVEIIVDGALYFPDWERPPFGIGWR